MSISGKAGVNGLMAGQPFIGSESEHSGNNTEGVVCLHSSLATTAGARALRLVVCTRYQLV